VASSSSSSSRSRSHCHSAPTSCGAPYSGRWLMPCCHGRRPTALPRSMKVPHTRCDTGPDSSRRAAAALSPAAAQSRALVPSSPRRAAHISHTAT
jgi:hypothetical protein